ncbi:ABC transporter ATP-binding protein [Clostridium botulinum]|uniref:ABC transporter ATP-binding protein n=1 Tax=Clostridium botulinum TaxID=1491 RepID=A0A9Q1UW55_CLOBO|nr:ABC transporter ATP-binding protein [Clostridium botulinum]AEB74987.1 ABC transporter, ATP-binding protein [Clostridium botulinum BKT015925]KEI01782.1 ABC transporter ATP-binding protein [Clostridium botulinum C/D str. Sp77]KEI03628.1 ABC transporter ATP-binding protein [Clostridium botulinum D str. 16868]KLU76983.1 ABC transporter ATP-binding protein [Clostridium botulinum V891]KOA73977.1 ABC transporter ATP-binding protein [Clostridium botulinum]
MIKIENLTKEYHKVLAVNNMSFEVNDGEIAVLLGPNGAGKSTTIKCISGLLRYKGSIEIQGYKNKTLEAKRLFSYVPETPVLYDMLTIYEHLEYIANAYKIDNYEKKADILLKQFELHDKKDKLGKELSKGMQQKVSICCGLLTEPKVILFDEPMIGLDPKAIKELKKVFLDLKERGCTVIISTHIIDSIDDIWDKAIIVNKGNIVFETTRENLKTKEESLEEIFFEVTEA